MFTRSNVVLMLFLAVILAAFAQPDCADALLNWQSENANQKLLDIPEAPLPSGAVARLGKSDFQANYPGTVSITFLSDDRAVILGGPKNTVAFWHARTANAIRSAPGQLYMAISSNGRMMATRKDRTDKIIRFINLETETIVGSTEAPRHWARFCFSPDGKLLAIDAGDHAEPGDLPLRVVHVPSGKEAARFKSREGLLSLAFSNDGKKIATSSALSSHNSIWDVETGKELRNDFYKDFGTTANRLIFSPDDRFLVGHGSGLGVWETETGRLCWLLTRVQLKDDGPACWAYSPNGKMIAAGMHKGTIRIFDAANGGERGRFDSRLKNPECVAFSPDGVILASVSRGHAPLIWDVTGLILDAGKVVQPFTAEQVNERWHALSSHDGADASNAWQTICGLSARPEQALPLLKKRLRPAAPMSPNRLDRLLKELDSDDFNVREKAMSEFVDIGPAAEPRLRKLLAENPSDTRKRSIEDLIGDPPSLREPISKGRIFVEDLRHSRAMEVLEYIGTADAKKMLEALAQGEPTAQRTLDAKAALTRLAKRPAPSSK